MAEYYIGNVMVSTDNSYLEHHGIQGQKWGLRRYRNYDGTLTSAGKARYGGGEGGSDGSSSSKSSSSVGSRVKAAVKKASETVVEATKKKVKKSLGMKTIPDKEKDPEGYEAAKQKAIKSGTADEVMQFKGDLTNKELGDAYQRLNYENLISKYTSEGQKVPKEISLESSIKKVTDYINTGLNLAKSIQSVKEMRQEREEAKKPKKRSEASKYAEDAYTEIFKDLSKRLKKDKNATIDFAKVQQAYKNANQLSLLEQMFKEDSGGGKKKKNKG